MAGTRPAMTVRPRYVFPVTVKTLSSVMASTRSYHVQERPYDSGQFREKKPMVEIDGYEILGLGQYFEDLPVGRKFRTIGRTLTESDLVNFIGVTGMTEVLFSNTEFLANESDIKQRVVPGAMVYSFAEGLLVHATMQHTGFAFLNMELNVAGPTFAGDTIHVECEVVESRRSASRPNRGLVRTFNRVKKQDGSVVITYNPLRMVKARGTGT
jgi:acyl dehydratase